MVQAILGGKTPPPPGIWEWVYWAGRITGASWRVPSLSLDIPQAWTGMAPPDSTDGIVACPVVRHKIRQEMKSGPQPA